MKLQELINRLQLIADECGSDLEIELVTGHRTTECEMIMEETASVEAVTEDEQTFVRIRACKERSWY